MFRRRSQKAERFHNLLNDDNTHSQSQFIPNSRSSRGRKISRRGVATGNVRRVLVLCSAGLFGAFVFGLLSDGGRRTADPKPFIPRIDKLVAGLGFGIDVITIRGHRYASDTDIFDALSLDEAHSFVRFDSAKAQRRIETLSWVKDVEIKRVLPNRLELTIREREPFVVWQDGQGLHLVDGEGRVLSGTDERGAPDLPRIAGKSAPKHAAQLFAVLVNHPRIAARLLEARRIAERRWSLHLNNGTVIHLPADAESAALARLNANQRLLALVDKSQEIIDLRTESSIVVRSKTRTGNKAALSRQSNALRAGSS